MRLAVLFFLLVGSAMAEEPDFWIDFTQCKNLVAYLLLSNESLGLLEGDPTLLRCTQNGTQMSCRISFPEGGNSVEQHQVCRYLRVETAIAGHPPHRSGRDQFGHPVPR